MRFKLFILFIILFKLSYSQINFELKEEQTHGWPETDKKKLATADKYFSKREFLFARPIYDTLYRKYKTNTYVKYLLGTCNLYDSRYHASAEILIKECESIKPKLIDYDYYLGRAYLRNEKYKEALAQFELYSKNPLDADSKTEVEHQISICNSSILLKDKFAVAKITNIGFPINSEASEYTPILPSNESFIVFTYRGKQSMGGKQSSPNKPDEKDGVYFEDVMRSTKDEHNNWQKPMPIEAINTTGHDAAVYISHDGSKLFIYKNVGVGSGDIYVSKLEGENWSVPEKVKGINSNYWEGSVCLSPDEKTIYFSSERQGRFGGRDLYSAILLADGSWGNVKNLGPEINTKFNEDAPFIHSDGKTLFFASTGHNTMGGYDIFRSELKQGKWEVPYNVGKPVNTPQHDKFYVVSSDGERGYYSSENKVGLGMQDIYMVEPGLFGKPTALVMVTGNVSYDNKPVKAEINVRSKLNRKDFSGIFSSNSSDGSYLVNLPSGNEYEIIYKYLNTVLTKDISTALIDSFAQLELSAELFSEDYKNTNLSKVDSIGSYSENLSDLSLTYEQLLAKYGNVIVDSLEYTVQIGAYKLIDNFDYSKLIGLPKAMRKTFTDNITRFTLGSYKTLSDANTILLKAKKNGIKDAFIIAVYKNQRYYFKELLNQNVLK